MAGPAAVLPQRLTCRASAKVLCYQDTVLPPSRASAPAHTTVVRGGGGDRHRGCPSVPDLLQISSGPTEDGRCD